MKRVIVFISISIVLILSLSMKEEDKNIYNKTIKVAGDINYPPYEYLDSKGAYTGFNVDIIKEIGNNENIKIEIYPMSWEKAIKALENKEVDIVQGMSLSENRNKKFIFSEPIIENDYVIFTLKENKEITSVIDLQDKRVSYQSSDLAEEFLKVINRESIEKNTQSEAINLLLNKEVDAFIGNKLTGMHYLQKIGSLHRVEIQGSPLLKNTYSIAASKDNTEIIKLINNGINKLKSTNDYEKIYNKWFGNFSENTSNTLKIILIAVVIMFTLSVIGLFVALYYKEYYKKKCESLLREKNNDNKRIYTLKENILEKDIFLNGIIENADEGIMIFNKDNFLEVYNNKSQFLLPDCIERDLDWKSLQLYSLLGGYNPNIQGNIERNVEILVDNLVKRLDIKISILRDDTEENIYGFMVLLRKSN